MVPVEFWRTTMRWHLPVATFLLGVMPLWGAEGEVVKLSALRQNPGRYEGKTIKVNVQVSGALVDLPLGNRVGLTVKDGSVIVAARKGTPDTGSLLFGSCPISAHG